MFNNLKKHLLSELPNKIKLNHLTSYENFGKEIEPHISDIIEEYLDCKKIKFDAYRAPDKNHFPDLTLTIKGTEYAVEYKCGLYNNSGNISNEPANDLGTLNSYTKKIKKFKENIFCIFIKYSINSNSIITLDDIYIDRIYKFVGKKIVKSQILAKYREKDGNLRPKNWKDFDSSTSYFVSLEEFKKALYITNKYRALQISLKNLEKLSTKELLDCKKTVNFLLAKNKKHYK